MAAGALGRRHSRHADVVASRDGCGRRRRRRRRAPGVCQVDAAPARGVVAAVAVATASAASGVGALQMLLLLLLLVVQERVVRLRHHAGRVHGVVQTDGHGARGGK